MEAGSGGQVIVGGTAVYKARGTFSDGSTDNISDECEWSVDDPRIASVDNELPRKGTVTGLSFEESTTVRVVCAGGLTASAGIDVVGDVLSVAIEPASFEGPVLASTRLRAVATYEGGVVRDVTDKVLWFSTDPAIATVDATTVPGTLTLVAPGSALVVATTSSGHSATCSILVTP
jgi:uncharacterized protein YjdB